MPLSAGIEADRVDHFCHGRRHGCGW